MFLMSLYFTLSEKPALLKEGKSNSTQLNFYETIENTFGKLLEFFQLEVCMRITLLLDARFHSINPIYLASLTYLDLNFISLDKSAKHECCYDLFNFNIRCDLRIFPT